MGARTIGGGYRSGARACASKNPPKVEFPELPFDVIPLVLRAIFDGGDDRDPRVTCRAAMCWSTLNKTHREACIDEKVWDDLIARVFPAEAIAKLNAACSKSQWFGEWTSYEDELCTWSLHPDAFYTPQDFFYELCYWAWKRRMTPLWNCMAKYIRNVPFDYPHYFEIAKIAAMMFREDKSKTPFDDMFGGCPNLLKGEHGLSEIPTDMPRYGEIVRWAVQKPIRGRYVRRDYAHSALKWVSTDRADYGELARLAIEAGDPTVMNWVPTDRDDYGELARLAMKKKADSVTWIKTDHANYREIAKYAIKQHRGVIEYLPKTHPDYPTLLEFHRSQWKNWKTGATRVRARRGGARTG